MSDQDWRQSAANYAVRTASSGHEALRTALALVWGDGVEAGLRAALDMTEGARLDGTGIRAKANRDALDQVRNDLIRALRNLRGQKP